MLLNGAKLKFVSYTSNLSEQMYDLQKRTMFPPEVDFESSRSPAKISVLEQSQSASLGVVYDFSNLAEFFNNPSILVRLENLLNAIESLVNNIKFHLRFYSTQSFSLSCLQRSFVNRHFVIEMLDSISFKLSQQYGFNRFPMSRSIKLSLT